MPELIMLVGLPASGKSTFRAEHIENRPGVVVISSDDYIDLQAAKSALTYSDVFDIHAKDADRACRAAFKEAVARGDDIIIDRTNMTAKGRRSFLALLPKTYVRYAHVFQIPEDVLNERLIMRAKATGKNIPAAVIKNMRSSYEEPTLHEFDAVWVHNGVPSVKNWGALKSDVQPSRSEIECRVEFSYELDVTSIARVAHEANRAYCASIGDDSQPTWEDAPDWQKKSAIDGVAYHTKNPDAAPHQSHENWLAEKTRDGWSFGPVKCPETKQHPCFVSYEDLPQSQRCKDYIFGAVVKTMLAL